MQYVLFRKLWFGFLAFLLPFLHPSLCSSIFPLNRPLFFSIGSSFGNGCSCCWHKAFLSFLNMYVWSKFLSNTHAAHTCHFLSFSFNGNLPNLTGLRLMHTTELKTNSYLTFTWIFSFHDQKDLDFQVDLDQLSYVLILMLFLVLVFVGLLSPLRLWCAHDKVFPVCLQMNVWNMLLGTHIFQTLIVHVMPIRSKITQKLPWGKVIWKEHNSRKWKLVCLLVLMQRTQQQQRLYQYGWLIMC